MININDYYVIRNSSQTWPIFLTRLKFSFQLCAERRKTYTHVISWRIFAGRRLYRVRNEAQNGAEPE